MRTIEEIVRKEADDVVELDRETDCDSRDERRRNASPEFVSQRNRGDAEVDERIELHLVMGRVVAEDDSFQREIDGQGHRERGEKRALGRARCRAS